MQFDFIKRLFGNSEKVAPRAARPAEPVPKIASPPGDTLQSTARTLLHAAGATALATRVRVEWNARMRSTAGVAFPGRALVRLNPRLREFGADEIDRTLRHELAHLLAHHRAGRRRISPHGREWQQACRDLGLTDEKRCHDLPLPRRQITARHFYRCPHCAMELQRVRPLRGKSACLACCRRYNGGSYADKFRFTKIPAPPP